MNKIIKKYLILIIIIFVAIIFLKTNHDTKNAESNKANKGNILSSFEDKKTWGISPERGFSLRLSRKYATEGRHSLEVVFPKWNLPSINTKKLKQNWGEYEYFAFDVYNPQKESIKLTVRLDDTAGQRTNIAQNLNPGPNAIKIARKKILKKIDASNIKFVVLFLEEPEKRYRLYFDNMHLERSELIAGLEREALPQEGTPSQDTMSMRKAVLLSKPEVPKTGSIQVPIAKIKEVAGNRPLISSGVPFALGQLKSAKDIVFLDKEGKEIPIAVKVLARWPQDNSIRSILVQFRYPIEKVYQYVTLQWGASRKTKDLEVVEPKWAYPEGMMVIPREWLCISEVIGEQVPFGQYIAPQYDENIEKYFYKVKDIGWTGDLREDGYYSTPHTFYQLYVRSGELKYFLAARKELLHYRENQIILEGKDRGRSIVDNDPRYLYLEALADDYFLTGDPRTLEVARYMVEFLEKHHNPQGAFYAKNRNNFWTERTQAFVLLGFLNYFEMTNETKYIKLADELMKNLYKTQLQWPSRGGFIHNLYAHDPEEGARRDEYGGSPFMTGLLLEGIIKYHKLTQSDIAADSIFRALDWLIKEGLVSSKDSFKYLTADKYLNSSGDPDVNLLVVHGFGYGYKISGFQRKDYLDIGMKVLHRGIKDAYLEQRKHFNQNYRSSGHFLAYIKDSLQYTEKVDTLNEKSTDINPLENKNIFVFEGFEHSLGGLNAQSDTGVSIDKETVYLNGYSLKIKSKFSGSNLSAGINLESWNIEQYSFLSFAYKAPPTTPIGMRVQTEFGDWICLGGSREYRCPSDMVSVNKYTLTDDGQWHEVTIDVKETVHQALSKINNLVAFQFFTDGNTTDQSAFWIDDFKIRK